MKRASVLLFSCVFTVAASNFGSAEVPCIKESSTTVDVSVSGKITRVKAGNYTGRKEFRIAGCGPLDIVVDNPPKACSKGRLLSARGTYLTCSALDQMLEDDCDPNEVDSLMVESIQCK